MRVLVTGADGFIGSHLVERLLSEGQDVRAFCMYNSNGSRGWLDGLEAKNLTVRLGDIRDARQVEEACRGVDVIYHLAALIAIPYSYEAPESYIQTNVLGTLNILEGARRAEVGRVVITSTSEVYGTPATLPIRETHPLQAQSPYAASKIAADQLALSYHRSFGLPVVVLRPFNTYGPRQSSRAVLPSIIRQLLVGKTVRLGRLDTRRDLTYVSDTVDGFVRAGSAKGIEGEVIQLGTGHWWMVDELVVLASGEIWNRSDVRIVQRADLMRPNASEVMVLQADPSKARTLLGWEARVQIAEGIWLTTDWLRRRLPEVA